MNFVTIGTGHGDPNLRRGNSSLLLRCSGNDYLFDAGDGACTQLIRCGGFPSALSALFISHLHDDHGGGIASIVKGALKYRWKYPEKQLRIFLPEAGAVKPLEKWLDVFRLKFREGGVRIETCRPGIFFNDGIIRVCAIPTAHIPPGAGNISRSFAWTVESEKARILMTGDLAGDFSDFPLEAAESFCDVIVCELTHFRLENALPVLKKINCGELVFTHIHDPWDEPEGMESLRQIRQELPYPVITAEDGMNFTI